MSDAADRYQPWASSPAVRLVMQGNRKRDTRPELSLRRAVHAAGLRYRVATRPLPERPWTADLVFRPARVAVFVDGCYWHGCPDHYNPPRTNSGYWSSKIGRNRSRDALVDSELQAAGWSPLRIWEHEPTEAALDRVVQAVRRARSTT
jgi:DNA mismatch endonuclease (patch repair protein)